MSNLGVLTRFLLLPLSVSIAAALIARATVVQTYAVPSASMEPTLEPGDHIVVTPYRGAFSRRPDPGDVVVFRAPGQADQLFVKRVVAGPGDMVEVREGFVYRNGRRLQEPYVGSVDLSSHTVALLGQDEFFVLGDNRGNSLDSRVFGPVPGDQLVGRVRLIFWSAASGESEAHARGRWKTLSHPAPVRWSRLLAPVD